MSYCILENRLFKTKTSNARCRFNPASGSKCANCGWNNEVNQARLEKLHEEGLNEETNKFMHYDPNKIY